MLLPVSFTFRFEGREFFKSSKWKSYYLHWDPAYSSSRISFHVHFMIYSSQQPLLMIGIDRIIKMPMNN